MLSGPVLLSGNEIIDGFTISKATDRTVPARIRQVAVIGASESDYRLIRGVPLALRCHFFTTDCLSHVTATHFDAIVLFHRGSAESLSSSLLFHCIVSRFIVVSDCTDEQSIVNALYSGAHYFFDINDSDRLLQIRITAALRPHTQDNPQIVEFYPFVFHVISRTLYRDKDKIDLSPREFELAYYLFSNAGRLILDTELLTGIWTLPSTMDTRRIDTAICRVRNKLGLQHESSEWSLIRLRGQGYRLVSQAGAMSANSQIVESID